MGQRDAIVFGRRGLVGLAGAAAAGPALAQQAAPPALLRDASEACRLTPRATEGPFYFDPRLERSEISEGRPGMPLELRLQVVEGATCRPLPGARIDVWHCDALGAYSGYRGQSDGRALSTQGQTFLRGSQPTDGGGMAMFRTIYPGWYRGRTPHVHFKVLLEGNAALTGQCYFPEELNDALFASASPYRDRAGRRDTTNATDGILRASGGGPAVFLAMQQDRDRYVGSLLIAVAPRPGGIRSDAQR